METDKKLRGNIRVAIVDDDEGMRLCFKDMLQTAGDFSLVGSFPNAAKALSDMPALCPDLALMDIRLPDLNGIECARRLKQAVPHLKIVIVAGTHETNWVADSLQAGAVAYLVKPFVEDQLLATMKFAMASHIKTNPGATRRAVALNLREKEVLKNLAEGLLYKEISEKLGISYAAVHKCQHNIFKKLHVSNRSEAARIWLDSYGFQ